MVAFFDMGGYGGFVWPAYAIVAFVMVGLWIMSRRFQRTSSDELAALNPRAHRRQQEPNDET
jgi:heme exporter protein D